MQLTRFSTPFQPCCQESFVLAILSFCAQILRAVDFEFVPRYYSTASSFYPASTVYHLIIKFSFFFIPPFFLFRCLPPFTLGEQKKESVNHFFSQKLLGKITFRHEKSTRRSKEEDMRVRLTDIKFRVVFLETKLIPNFSKQEIKNMSCRFFFFQETTPNLSLLRLVVVAMGLF